jgi:hypothetical protein
MKHFSKNIALGLLLTVSPAGAASLSLTATADTSLFEDLTGSDAGGGDTSLFVGRVGTNDGTPLRRGLVQFDLSSIPAGSTINSVSLRMTVTQVRNSTAQTTTVHRVTTAWQEGTATTSGGRGGPRSGDDATWLFRDSTNSWSTAGGDFLGVASASQSVAGLGLYNWTGAGLVNDVQAWVNGSATNAGWLLRGNEASAQSVKVFATREFGTTEPQLLIDFTAPVPEPTALAFLSCCLLGVARRRR